MPALYDLLDSLADIDRLIASEQRESETLEYKTADRPLTAVAHAELAKDISALANSAGGTIIYGVATDREDRTKPVNRVAINHENIDVILQVIATHIRHPIPKLRWKTIPRGGLAEVLLIDVPQSPLAPHQVAVRDYRYYRRHGAISEPMGHDLLELYFGRRLGPILEPEVELTAAPPHPHAPMAGRFWIRFRAYNAGQRLARYAMVMATAVRSDKLVVEPGTTNGKGISGGSEDTVTFGTILTDNVIHPGISSLFCEYRLTVHQDLIGDAVPLFLFDYHADEMQAVGGTAFLVRDANGAFSLTTSKRDRMPHEADDADDAGVKRVVI
jgi:hypothetical protein